MYEPRTFWPVHHGAIIQQWPCTSFSTKNVRYSIHPMKSAILRLKKKNPTNNAIQETGSQFDFLIKWLDLNCMLKLTACTKQMRV